MPMPSNLPPVVSFHDAGFMADFYSPDGLEVVARRVPVLQIKDVDTVVTREDGGVAFQTADFTGLIPLTNAVTGAGRVKLTDIRRGQALNFLVQEIDDDPSRWIMMVVLMRYYRPIDG